MKKITRLSRLKYLLVTRFTYGLKDVGKRAIIYAPMQIDNPDGIHLNDHAFVHHYAWLMGTKIRGEKGLVIGENTVVGHFSHLIAWKGVEIGKNVLIADRVFISDCTHEYRNIDAPVIKQEVKCLQPITVGDDTWIGENVCICGSNVGKHCVIGANSVVIHDIPDYCVAAGNPAKIIKRYDFERKEWVRV